MNSKVLYIDHADSHRICSCLLAGNDWAHQRSGVQVGYARVTSRGPRAYSTGLPNLDIFLFSRRIVVIEPEVVELRMDLDVCFGMAVSAHVLLELTSSSLLSFISLSRAVQLEKEVAEKEYLCKRIMEEMKYFKVLLSFSLSPFLYLNVWPSFILLRWNCNIETCLQMEGKRRRMPERTRVHPLVHVKSLSFYFSAPSL